MRLKVFLGIVIVMMASGVGWSQTRHDSAVMMVDVSQTTGPQDLLPVGQRILRQMNQRFPEYVQSAGVQIFGNETNPVVAWPLQVKPWNRAEVDQVLAGLKNGGGPTPMGLAVNKSEAGLAQAKGKTALIIASDGRDNGWTSPVEEVKALKAKHGDNLCVFAIQLGNNAKGRALLEELVKVGGCGKFTNASELSSEAQIQALVDYIFPTEAVVPPPPPKPKDLDGDGVLDKDDQCPGTLKGAKVDARGCWVIENVRFATGSAVIDPKYFPKLNNVVDVLKANPGAGVIIEGHTDDQGDEQKNLTLSQSRAESVMKYLTGKGIEASRLSATGKGESKPIADNKTPEGRAQNRRIEIQVKP